jgi:DNA (cytosine-5)-methyltransferase 1
LKIKELVVSLRKESPNCIINIWASLECTHFSKAKGGLSRDADSRTLADHLYKYIEQIDPDYVYIENVREFMTWGPLDKNGKPIKSKKGIDYNRWKEAIKFYGYEYQSELLNSADYGAYTSRERYFGIFARIGMPILFPQQTHIKRSKIKGTDLKPWKAVKEVLHLQDHGRSIFGLTKLGKRYSDNTLKRVYAGLLKFAKEGLFVKHYNGGDPFHKSNSVKDPLGTILTSRTHALVTPVFLTSYYGNGNAHSIDDPCNTLTTKERYAAQFINYASSTLIDTKHNLISNHWTVDTQYSNSGRSIDKPGQTLIARMDKKPVYLISANMGTDQRKCHPEDSETVVKIREFMIINGIRDIKIRMLNIMELKAIQGFPEEFQLTGTKTNQLKFIGNSVVPLVAQKLVESNWHALIEFLNRAA